MLDTERIPAHVAIVMDGNGRWAKKHNMPRVMGHNAGMKAMKEIVKRASQIGVKYLTVYAFSTENWKRSAEEVSGIFGLLVKYVDSELEEIYENDVRVDVLGDYSPLPQDAVNSIEKAKARTKECRGMRFNIALNYGARDEITRAVRALCADAAAGIISPDDVDESAISGRLYTGQLGIPDPELVIRTSGEKRLSNYLLWQSAYSEFVFTDVLWPDFTPEEFEKAIEEYQSRDRRFGGR